MSPSWRSPRVWTGAAVGFALIAAVVGDFDRTVLFDLTPGEYRDSVAKFATGVREIEVDLRQVPAQIPLILPGPADAWAGATAHALRIRLAQPSPRPLILSLHAVETHDAAPPQLTVAVNDVAVQTVVTRRGTGFPPPHADRGVRSRYTIRIPPATFGHATDVRLSIINASGAWVMWERVRLVEADRTLAWAHLAHHGPLPPLSAAFLAASLETLLLGSLVPAMGQLGRPRTGSAAGSAAALIVLGVASATRPDAPAVAGVPWWLWLAAPWALLALRTAGSVRGAHTSTTVGGVSEANEAASRRRARPAVSPRLLLVNSTLSLLALAASLALTEAALRFAYRDVRSSADARTYFGQRSYEANSFGFREREFHPAKPPNTYRIALIGDSISFGQGVPTADRFGDRLERHLNAERRHGLVYQVLNFGAPGSDTVDHVQLLRALVLNTRPDFVLLQWYVNDFENGDHADRPQPLPFMPSATLHRTLLRSSALYALLYGEWVSLQEKIGLIDSYSGYMSRRFGNPEGLDSKYAIERIKEFVGECKTTSTPVGVVLFPHVGPGLVRGAYEYDYLHERVLRACDEAKIACLDLRSTFARYTDYRKLWATPLDPHPGALANQLAAERLIEVFGPTWLHLRREPSRPAPGPSPGHSSAPTHSPGGLG